MTLGCGANTIGSSNSASMARCRFTASSGDPPSTPSTVISETLDLGHQTTFGTHTNGRSSRYIGCEPERDGSIRFGDQQAVVAPNHRSHRCAFGHHTAACENPQHVDRRILHAAHDRPNAAVRNPSGNPFRTPAAIVFCAADVVANDRPIDFLRPAALGRVRSRARLLRRTALGSLCAAVESGLGRVAYGAQSDN